MKSEIERAFIEARERLIGKGVLLRKVVDKMNLEAIENQVEFLELTPEAQEVVILEWLEAEIEKKNQCED